MSDLYAVLHVVRWESLRTSGGLDVSVQAFDGSVGFCPIYATREAAQAAVDREGRPATIAVLKEASMIPGARRAP